MPAGRPSTLNPEVRDLICQAIRDGNYRNVAAEWAGVSVRTLSAWMTRGRADPDGPYGELLRAVLEAERAAEMAMVEAVFKAARSDPRHAQWYLERKFPQRWGSQRAEIRDLKRRLDALEKGAGGGVPRPTEPQAPPADGAAG